MTTYIIVDYCSECDTTYKHNGRGPADDCEVCGKPMVLSSVEKYSAKDPNMREEVVNVCYKETPRYSVALGVSETQIDDARKLHPGVEWKKFGHSYRPLIRNRTEKLKIMKQAGFEEFDESTFKGDKR